MKYLAMLAVSVVLCLTCPQAAALDFYAQPMPRHRYQLADSLLTLAQAVPKAIEAAPAGEQPIPNFGLMTDQIGKRGGMNHYELNGRPIAQGDAMQAVTEGVPADENLLRVTVIGPDALRQRVVTDLTAAPANLRDRCLVQSYPPNHWAVQAGFQAGGAPTVYVQAPDGQVLHRQDDYDGGPTALFEAIRKADPHYSPAADPDLRKTLSLSELRDWGLVALVAFGIVVWWHHTHKTPPAPPMPKAAPVAQSPVPAPVDANLALILAELQKMNRPAPAVPAAA